MSENLREKQSRLYRSRYLAKYLGGTAAAIALVATSGVTMAQDAADDSTEFDEIVVTGSRIIRKDVESISPLAVTTADEVKFAGHQRVEDLMNSMPQLEGAASGYDGNGTTGTASLDLRGLGTNRTLVLINGRRMQPGGIYTNAVDINQVPGGLLKRVEVLTGGASATYGADAVAGVVNFVIDTDFEGIKVSASAAGYQHNNNNDLMQNMMDNAGFSYPTGSTIDGAQYSFDFAMGSSFADGKGHVSAYINYRTTRELKQESRDYSSCALHWSGAERCGGSGNAIVPNFDVYPIDPATGETDYASATNRWITLDSGSNFIDSVDNLYNYAPINHFQRPDKRYAAGAFLNYEFNENMRPYMELMFSRDVTTGQYAESGTFFDEEYKFKCSTPLLSDSQRADICGGYGLSGDDEFAVYIGKRNVEGGPRRNNLTHNSLRFVIGMDGQINDNWRYDASLTYGSTNSDNTYENDFFGPRITSALDVVLDGSGNQVCANGDAACIPYNIFTYQGVTPEQANTLTAVGIITGQTQMTVANAYVSGDLPFAIADDPVQAVLGVEYRKEQYRRTSDDIFELGQLLGLGGPQPSIDGQYDVKEFFAEAAIPLIQDAEFAQDLSLELAIRYSDYSTTGTATTYKAGISWQPIDEIKFRGGYNRASRAPNVRELFIPQNRGLWSGTDVCAGATPSATAAQCANTGVSADQYGNISVSPAGQYNALYGGNPDLNQETGDTFTFGIVATPMPGLTLTVDYWDIKISDLISSIGPELANTQCALTGNDAFCNLVSRSPSGSLWLGSAGRVTSTNQNLGFTRQKGIDIDGQYSTDLGDGQLSLRMVATYMIKKFTQEIPDYAPSEYECVGQFNGNCFPSPKWRHTLAATYDSGDFWRVGVKWRYFSKIDDDSSTLAFSSLPTMSYIDLSAGFEITENLNLAIGINNIFDKEPPLVNGTYNGTNGNTFPAVYDPLGRRLFATLTAQF